ncbi:S-protein homolog 1-like [Benincasa hispida]|uniref:S-protein homolog 1-like n=1 Tax=Benincasa hispida TaxID=102211 RepID=UPI0018FFC19A|nr:S-protein homolog 1-like [Benincasa hispida]
MGSSYMRMVSSLVLLGLVLIQQPLLFAKGDPVPLPLQKWHVHVVNGLKNATLFVHCKSKDDDLGPQHLVSNGAEFQWSFKINIWRTTLYWCSLHKPNADVSFDAFWVERRHIWLHYRCMNQNCFWMAKDDGIYLRNNPDAVDEFVHKWDEARQV